MAERTRVTCKKCSSFLHNTEDCEDIKVLGFKEEDGYRKKQFMGHDVLEFEEVDTIPSVSVKWLEKYVKEWFWSTDSGNICTEDDFLEAVSLQAVEEKDEQS